MRWRQEAPSVAITNLCRCGRKPIWLLQPAPGRSPEQPPTAAREGSAPHCCQQPAANPQSLACHGLAVAAHTSWGAGRAPAR